MKCPNCKGKLKSNPKLDKRIQSIEKQMGFNEKKFIDLYCLSCLVRYTFLEGKIVSGGNMSKNHLDYFKESK